METAQPSPQSCSKCHKPQSDLPQPLKRCAKCQTTLYCSRECQKDDWKVHKRICASQAAAHDGPSAPSPTSNPSSSSSAGGQHNPGFHSMNQMLGLARNDFLHKLPERQAMVQLIDCFRMRCEDEYAFGANTVGIYNGDDPLPDFNEFLTLAEKRNGILPSWWNNAKRRECVRLATGGDQWADISSAVEKSDIQEHYGDSMMPAKLRILGEKIYGKGFM
ncbi:hypothetical protein BDZ45DRAFT_671659 [Acephala macrosclerotiorum]|nr:hypothetical protein BDZ45DRAFT_671659 [Acephala macrosclerotiorum]